MLPVAVVPFALAVTVAVWLEGIAPTTAAKPAATAPCPTITPPGTVTFPLLLDSATVSPPAGAAPLRVTVQGTLPGEVTFDGLQVTPVGTTREVCPILIVPPAPDVEYDTSPEASVAATPLIEMAALELLLAGEIVNVATAICPLGIAFLVRSNMMQVVELP